ncbi:MAG TPA: hypothetical protein VGH89_23170 [Pseudonocardia sp.]|jgi:hypothetical protein
MTFPPPILTRRALLRVITSAGAVATAATLSACGTSQRPSAVPGPSATAVSGTLVMIIRHGEKPDASSRGVDMNGNPTAGGSLTQAGWNRARALVEVFAPANGHLRPGLARPRMIYAAGATEGGSGERARETVTPLAQRLGIPVNTRFGKGEEQALAAQITAQPGPTLICWQHGEIPAITQAFGSLTPAPPATWPADRFDVIWTLTAHERGWVFSQPPEMVLPGDQSRTITK